MLPPWQYTRRGTDEAPEAPNPSRDRQAPSSHSSQKTSARREMGDCIDLTGDDSDQGVVKPVHSKRGKRSLLSLIDEEEEDDVAGLRGKRNRTTSDQGGQDAQAQAAAPQGLPEPAMPPMNDYLGMLAREREARAKARGDTQQAQHGTPPQQQGQQQQQQQQARPQAQQQQQQHAGSHQQRGPGSAGSGASAWAQQGRGPRPEQQQQEQGAGAPQQATILTYNIWWVNILHDRADNVLRLYMLAVRTLPMGRPVCNPSGPRNLTLSCVWRKVYGPSLHRKQHPPS